MSNFIDTYGDVIGISVLAIVSWVLYDGVFILDAGVEGDMQCLFSLLMVAWTCFLALCGYVIYDEKKKKMENC